jgi:hypothetical protein
LTPSHAKDRWFLRVSTSQAFTEQRHIDGLWELIDGLA